MKHKMKQGLKRTISLLLVLSLILGITGSTVSAEGPPLEREENSTAVMSDMEVSGSSDVGNLIASAINQKQSEGYTASAEGNHISRLEVIDSSAVVQYSLAEDTEAEVVVAVYDKDQPQMYASGRAVVSGEAGTVEITIEGNIPRYFFASAFLLNAETHEPLCDEFTTELYTREIQEIKDATIDDFHGDEILNLDEDNTTNFAVYKGDIVIAKAGESHNQIEDNGSGTYTVHNADSSFKNLAEGDTVSYECEDGTVLLIKAEAVSVSGDTVTIREDPNPDLADFFDYIKIEADASDPSCTVTVDDSTADEGVTITPVEEPRLQAQQPQPLFHDGTAFADEPMTTAAEETDPPRQLTHSLDLNLKFGGGDSDDPSREITLTGKGSLSWSPAVILYRSWNRQYMKMTTGYSLELSAELSGAIRKKIPLGQLSVPLLPTVIAKIEPSIVVEASAKVKCSIGMESQLGFEYNNGKTLNLCTPLSPFYDELNLEGSLFIGIEGKISAEIIHKKLAHADIVPSFGVEFELSEKRPYGVRLDVLHECVNCLKGPVNKKISVKLELELSKFVQIDFDLLPEFVEKINDLYFSVDHMELGFGSCPHVRQRVDLTVTDTSGADVSGASISVFNADTGEEISHFTEFYQKQVLTNSYGGAVLYLPNGYYKITAAREDSEEATYTYIRVQDERTRAKIRMNSKEHTQPKPTAPVRVDIINDVMEITGDGPLARGTIQKFNYVIHDVIIHDGITTIGDGSFSGYDHLRSISIPSSVTYIGDRAFKGCSMLTKISLPAGITYIGKEAFKECSWLKEISIPAGVTYIGDRAFSYCGDMTSVSLPGGISFIGEGLFENCVKLTDISLPAGIDSIGADAFLNCTGLTGMISVPNGVSYIGDCAFKGCFNLARISIPDSVIDIGEEAFHDCCSLVTMSLPNHITYIKDNVFSGCNSLTSITLPDQLEGVGGGAFYGCTGLTGITLPDGVMIGYGAFEKCSGLTSLDLSGCKYIGEKAFADCSGLISVTLPDRDINIGWNAFSGSGLTSISIPAGVTTIGDYAFADCGSLTDVTLPAGLTFIGEESFKDCVSLTEISLPASIEYLGPYAFAGCTDMESIYFYGDVPHISWSLFDFITATVYYPRDNALWTDWISSTYMEYYNHEGTLTWEPFDPPEQNSSTEDAGNSSSETDAEPEAELFSGGEEAQSDLFAEEAGGEAADFTDSDFVSPEAYTDGKDAQEKHTEEVPAVVVYANIETSSASVAAYTELVPGAAYIFVVVNDEKAVVLFAPENLLYISQARADGSGNLSVSYIPRGSLTGTAALYGPRKQSAPETTVSPSPEASPSVIPSPEASPSVTPSPEASPSVTPSPEASPSVIPSPEASPSVTPSPEASPSVIPSPEASPSATPSPEASPSVTPSPEASPSATPSPEASPSATPSPEISPEPTLTPAPTAAPAVTGTPAPEVSPGASPTPVPTATPAPAVLPEAPKSFRAESVLGERRIYFTWEKEEDADGYQIFQLNDDGKYKRIKTILDPGAASYSRLFDYNTGYSFKIRSFALAADGTARIYSEFSDEIRVSTMSFSKWTAPSLQVSAKKGYKRIYFSWTAVPGADRYNIYRYDPALGKYQWFRTVGGTKTSCSNTDLVTYGTSYTFKIQPVALRADGTKVFGKSSRAASIFTPAGKVENVKAVPAAKNAVRITWDKAQAAKGYRVYRSLSKKNGYVLVKTITDGNVLSFTDEKAESGKTYYYKICSFACNSDKVRVWGAMSAVRSVKTH